MNEDRILYENYLKFKNCIKDRSFPRYEEPDLIEIFDVAGDNSDYYVQAEVLLLGVRLFPESEELFQRRGYLYNRLSPTALHDFLQNYEEGEGLTWEILKLRDRGLTAEEVEIELDRLLDEIDRLSDEEIIRLSEYARDQLCDEWFIRNRHKIEKKAEYRDTALYEIASVAHDSAEDVLALEILDKLTRIDAFRAENWLLMAECHYSLKQYDEALKDLEYARAINPDDVETDYIEAMNLVALGGNDEKVIELFGRFLKTNPRSLQAIHQTACALTRLGRKEECAAFLMSKFLEDVGDRFVLEELLSHDCDWNTRDIVARFREHSKEVESFDSFVKDKLDYMFRCCNYESVIKITDLYYDVAKTPPLIDHYLYSLAMCRNFDRLKELYDRAVAESISELTNAPDGLLYFAYAMLKTGEADRAVAISESGLALGGFWANSTERLMVVSCRFIFREIIRLARSGDRDSIASFEPFEPELFRNL